MSSWISSIPRKRILQTNVPVVSSPEKMKVYYVTNVLGGGAYKYIQDLIKYFPKTEFIHINTQQLLLKYKSEFNQNHLLLFLYVLYTDIQLRQIIDIVRQTRIKLVIPIHDFYFFSEINNDFHISVHNGYLKNNIIVPYDKKTLLSLADFVIFPTEFVKNEFTKYLDLKNVIICPHIDFNIEYQTVVPKIINKTINFGIINELTECKGIEYYKELFIFSNYKDYNINFHIFTGDTRFRNISNVIIHQRYNNEEIIELLHKNNIHSLLFLSKWGETYGYSLTHALISGLPILYSNVGSFVSRIISSEHYMPINPEKETKIVEMKNIINTFSKHLDYIIQNNGKTSYKSIEKHIFIPDFYTKLFN